MRPFLHTKYVCEFGMSGCVILSVGRNEVDELLGKIPEVTGGPMVAVEI